jgi:DNA-binding NarL/FixJ family response regulator
MRRHQHGDPTALMLSDFLTRRKLRDTGIYQEFFGPISVNTQLAAMAEGPDPIVVAVSLNDESRDFDERDRALLNLVRPFIGAAFAGVAARERGVPQPECLRSLGLTRRESEVLTLIAAGRTNKQIAAEFTVSPLTVKRHAENIYAKLEVSGRAEAAAVATSRRSRR